MFNHRVIWKNNLTLTDISIEMNNYLEGTKTIDFVAAQDKLFIGSELPFNHRWFEVSTVNDQASAISSAELWNGYAWVPMVDIIDETSVSGVTLAKSGNISWVPDRTASAWTAQQSTEQISDLSTLKIYNLYWVRLSFSADWKNTTALQFIGHKFSNDTDLSAEYPELSQSQIKTAYAAGKTTWNDQHLAAADQIIKDLKSKGIIWSKNQILDPEKFRLPSIHLTAAIIYRGMGAAYDDQRSEAFRSYKSAMDIKYFNVDTNANASLDDIERLQDTAWMSR